MLMHPTLISLGKIRTASIAFSLQSYITEGALGRFHPQALHMSFHNRLICGSQARHSVKGDCGSVYSLSRTTSICRRRPFVSCPSGLSRSPQFLTWAGNIGPPQTFALGEASFS